MNGDYLYADLKTAGKDRVVLMLNTSTVDDTVHLAQTAAGGHRLRDAVDDRVWPARDGFYAVPLAGLHARLLVVD